MKSLKHAPAVTPGQMAFMAFPMSPAFGNFSGHVVNVQQSLYLLAQQQAEIAVRAVHRRRRQIFARGVHLWN